MIQAFYDRLLPANIHQLSTLEHWVKGLSKEQAQALCLTREALMRHEAAGVTTDVFPKFFEWQGTRLALDYHFEPGSPRDGVTLAVPLFFLNQLEAERCEWLVPGMLKEKVHMLLKSLPQKIRRHCVPLPEYAASFYERWFEKLAAPGCSLTEAVSQDMWQQLKLRPVPTDFKPETLPAHLFMSFKVIDEHGRMLAAGRNLAQLKAEFGKQAQANFQQLATRDQEVASALSQDDIVDWSFGTLPELLEIRRKNSTVVGYPALVDRGTNCALDVFDDPHAAKLAHHRGLRRLFKIALRDQVKFLEKNLHDLTKLGMLYLTLGTQEQLRDQLIDCAIERACLHEPWPIDAPTFETRRLEGKAKLGLLAQDVARTAASILEAWVAAVRKLPQAKGNAAAHQDIQAQLSQLVPADFVSRTPAAQLAHMPRYLKAVVARIDKLRSDPARDTRLMADMAPLLAQYSRARSALKGAPDRGLDEFRWLLEELRVALFAQELRTPMPVSAKRLQKAFDAMQR